MAECEYLDRCLFYNDKMKDSKGLGSIFKKKYCLAGDKNCARYIVCKKLGQPAVPIDLFPNMHDRAKKLIAGK